VIHDETARAFLGLRLQVTEIVITRHQLCDSYSRTNYGVPKQVIDQRKQVAV